MKILFCLLQVRRSFKFICASTSQSVSPFKWNFALYSVEINLFCLNLLPSYQWANRAEVSVLAFVMQFPDCFVFLLIWTFTSARPCYQVANIWWSKYSLLLNDIRYRLFELFLRAIHLSYTSWTCATFWQSFKDEMYIQIIMSLWFDNVQLTLQNCHSWYNNNASHSFKFSLSSKCFHCLAFVYRYLCPKT